ncbi:hypothetical protein [Desertimonas flava]|uniref:hypothetical protein n=1 Tax=Desertimonas flava TaxID=2064846 RepID=UPI0013C517BF|nr:hypothetical protein [Desertimonas flava]
MDDEITGLAANSTTLYATIESTDTVVALDAETLAEVTRIEIASVGGKSVAVGPIAASDRAVVIGDFDNVIVLDPATLDQLGRTDDLAGPVTAVTIGASWAYAVTSNGQLYRLDPADAGVLDDRDVPFGAVDECGLAAGATGVWVAASRAPALYDLESLDLVEYLDLGNALAVIGAGEDGALVRGSAAGRSAVFSIDGNGRVTGETAMPGGQCLARSGDSSHVWGREGNGLVRVSIG